MKIDIGNNNNINNSTIGCNNDNNVTNDDNKKDHKALKILIEIFIGIVVALISGYIIYKLGWNK